MILSLGIYAAMAQATGLPVAMTADRAVMVFVGRFSPVPLPARLPPAACAPPTRRNCSDDPIMVEGLNHWFGTGEARKQAIFNVSLTVVRGSLTILMGPSGSGKTTVLTLMDACARSRTLGPSSGNRVEGRRHRHPEAMRAGLASSFRRITCTKA